MADMVGPFNGTAPWSEGEWYNFAPAWAPSGIIGSPAASISAGDFAVTSSGLTLTVACNGDRAWIDGSGYKPDTDKTVPVTANANASLSRRDRIAIRRDLAAKTITVVRLAGTPASGTPTPPALTRTSGGAFDVPICSFLVPPNNGTTLTGFIDERGWLTDSSGTVGFASTAARDAYFPSPVQGQACTVNGNPHTHDGSAWRFILTGTAAGVSDATGFLTFPHGGGQTPTTWGFSPTAQSNDSIGTIISGLADQKNATNLVIRVVRTDQNAWFANNPVSFNWWAKF